MSNNSNTGAPQQPADPSLNSFAPFEEQPLPVVNNEGTAGSTSTSTSTTNQSSAENVIPTKQIRDGWGKTMTGLNSAWRSTVQATDKFVKKNKIDETFYAAKEKTIKVGKDLELDQKWKAGTTKVGEVAKGVSYKVRETTEVIGHKVQTAINNKKNSDDNNNANAGQPVVPDIPPSSAPIIYMDLDQQGGVKNKQDETVGIPAPAPAVALNVPQPEVSFDKPVFPEEKLNELKITEEPTPVAAPVVVAAAAAVTDKKEEVVIAKKEDEDIFVVPTPEPAAAVADDTAFMFSIDDDDDSEEIDFSAQVSAPAVAPVTVPAPTLAADEAK